jgi:hypothetical protein
LAFWNIDDVNESIVYRNNLKTNPLRAGHDPIGYLDDKCVLFVKYGGLR